MPESLTLVISIKDDVDCMEKNVETMLSQQDAHVQILLLDAGSSDGSRDRAKTIAGNNSRCRFLEIDAVSEAEVRNRTIELIRTPYVWFVNATASIPPGRCRELLRVVDMFEPDIVAFPTTIGRWGAGELPDFPHGYAVLHPGAKLDWFRRVRACFSPPTARIYKTIFLRSSERLKFFEDNAFEGFIHNWISTILAERVVVLPDLLFVQEKASRLTCAKSLGWAHHADIATAFQRVGTFLRSDPKYRDFLEPLALVSEESIGNHFSIYFRELKSLCDTIRAASKNPTASNPIPASNDPDVLFKRGIGFHRDGDVIGAITCYENVLSISYDHVGACHYLGVLALSQGRPESLYFLERSMRLSKPNAIYCNNYGAGLLAVGRDADALKAFKCATELKPDYADAWSNLGHAQMLTGRLGPALFSLCSALRLDPRHRDALRHWNELQRICLPFGGFPTVK